MASRTLLLIGHGSRDATGVAQFKAFAADAANFLQTSVVPCFLELADPPIVTALERAVAGGARHIVALPLFLGPAGHQKNDVPTTLSWAKQRWPDVQIEYGTPLGVHPLIVSALADRARETLQRLGTDVPAAQTAILLMGRGSRDPDANSNVAKLARLLWEGGEYGWVETAFYSLTGPGIEEGVRRCVALGARRVILLPHFLFDGVILNRTAERIEVLNAELAAEVVLADPLRSHPHVLALVRDRVEEVIGGSALMNCDLCKYRHRMVGHEHDHGRPQTSDHSHGLRGITLDPVPNHAAPPAPLPYTADGQPDWANSWQNSHELALHGGPAVRATLLEPVAPQEALADPERYAAVVAEIERGLAAVTGLATVASPVAGWVALQCSDEAAAAWLLRAILVENVLVRREGSTLFFPAGPRFTVEDEIRSIVAVAAKCCHYQVEHQAHSADGHHHHHDHHHHHG